MNTLVGNIYKDSRGYKWLVREELQTVVIGQCVGFDDQPISNGRVELIPKEDLIELKLCNP